MASTRRVGSAGGRRELLLETTLELIAGEGVDAVTHRRVAELAGVPLGSTTYWFSSRQQMVSGALEHFARLDIDAVRERFSGLVGRRGASRKRLVDEFAAYLVPQFTDDRDRTAAQYALLQEAARDPELRQVVGEWTGAWHDALAEIFAALDAPNPALEARMFLAMLDGLSIVQLAVGDPEFEHSVLRPALETWFARLERDAG